MAKGVTAEDGEATGWSARLSLRFESTAAANRSEQHLARPQPPRAAAGAETALPEGNGVCHAVLVHPPGGIVGDSLSVNVAVEASRGPRVDHDARSAKVVSIVRRVVVAETPACIDHAALEWMPQEAMAYDGTKCPAELHHHSGAVRPFLAGRFCVWGAQPAESALPEGSSVRHPIGACDRRCTIVARSHAADR